MKITTKTTGKAFILAALFFVAAIFDLQSAKAATFSDNFDSYADDVAVEAAGWSLDYTTLESSGCRSGKCLMATISTGGWLQYITHSLNEAAPYIRFYAKRTNYPGGAGGSKFLKLFGDQSGEGYANTTLIQTYQSGQFYAAITGDGSGTANDQMCNWYWGNHTPQVQSGCTGVASVHGGTLDMADNQWYEFEYHVYPNTNGNADGVIQLWVDGVLRLEYTGVVMRNDANTRNFSTFRFVDYVNETYTPSSPYQLWFDDVVVSQSYVGPIGGSDTIAPASPSGLSVL